MGMDFKISPEFLENQLPFEREIYVALANEWIDKENKRRRDQQQQ